MVIRDSYEWKLSEESVKRYDMRQIEPPMESCQGRLLKTMHKRRVQKVDMEMQNIELARLPPNFLQHDNVVGEWVDDDRIHAKS